MACGHGLRALSARAHVASRRLRLLRAGAGGYGLRACCLQAHVAPACAPRLRMWPLPAPFPLLFPDAAPQLRAALALVVQAQGDSLYNNLTRPLFRAGKRFAFNSA